MGSARSPRGRIDREDKEMVPNQNEAPESSRGSLYNIPVANKFSRERTGPGGIGSAGRILSKPREF